MVVLTTGFYNCSIGAVYIFPPFFSFDAMKINVLGNISGAQSKCVFSENDSINCSYMNSILERGQSHLASAVSFVS